jgi:hypothetical protein
MAYHRAVVSESRHKRGNKEAKLKNQTFALTPNNHNDIPRNIFHLILQEGVTEIPKELFKYQQSVVTQVKTTCYSFGISTTKQ